MASPDLSKYVDLTVYDLQPQEIYDAAVQYAATSFPEWEPVPGSVEDALLQAAASMTGQLLGAINRLPNGVVEALLKMYGIERNAGTAPTATVDITFTGSTGYTIPRGTRIGYTDTTDGDPILYVFETVATVNVPIGDTSSNASVKGIVNQKYPLLLDGQPLQMLSALPFVESVALIGNLNVGSDPEDDTGYVDRATGVFGQLSAALVLSSQMDRYALANYADVYRAKTFSRVKAFRDVADLSRTDDVVTAVLDENPTAEDATSTVVEGDVVRLTGADSGFNGTFIVDSVAEDGAEVYWSHAGANGSATATGRLHSIRFQDDDFDLVEGEYVPQNGYVTMYASAIGGASLSDSTLNTVRQDLGDRAVAGLIIETDHAAVVDVGIEVEVVKQPAIPQAEVQSGIIAALNGYVHPDFWPWETTIYRNEIISLLDRVTGVVRVVSVTFTDPSAGSLAEIAEDGTSITFKYVGVLPNAEILVDVVSG